MRELVAVELAVDALADRLTAAGLAVDAIEPFGRCEGVVVGKIVSKEAHPRADRLAVLVVDAGRHGTVRIVSGAPNLRAGRNVALALPGTRLASGTEIATVEIRGEPSQGAVVSEKEIGLSEEGAGVLEVPGRAAPGAPLAEALGTEDVILEIDVTPNRGDCLSLLGIAREVALLTGARLRARRPRFREDEPATAAAFGVSIEDPGLCPRYVARLIRGMTVRQSPPWMRMRLEALGIRSINNVVDVTNYVLLERGQPLHAFDADRLSGGTIVVRRAHPGDRIVTLDDVERILDPADLVIADSNGPVAIAGIMGGAASAVHDGTRTVLLEAACFAPASIRRSSRRLGLQSESSLRFERQVAAEGVASASERAVELFARCAGGHAARGMVDVYPGRTPPREVAVRPERVRKLLGLDLGNAEIRQTLRRVSSGVRSARGAIVCTAPGHRADLTREVDFIEEVARIVGYDRIPEHLPVVPIQGGDPGADVPGRIRRLLIAEGMNEMISLRFSSTHRNEILPGLSQGAPVRLVNPHSAETTEMRRSLVPGLLEAFARNRDRGEPWFRGFEVGTAFWTGEAIVERAMVAGLLGGARPARGLSEEARPESFFDAKGVVEALFEGLRLAPATWSRDGVPGFLHPGLSARIRIGDTTLGYLGSPHPSVLRDLALDEAAWVFELDTQKLETYASPRYIFQQLPRFPAVVRDLAIVAEEAFEARAVLDVVSGCSDLLVEGARLFDVYRGKPLEEGDKSLAVSISYRAADRTLTDGEVNDLHAELVSRVTTKLGVEVRR